MGMPLKTIIYDIGGGIEGDKLFKAVQTGGPSGGCIPQQLSICRSIMKGLRSVGSMMGSGGMVVLDETDCMVNIAKFFLSFTQEESCGKCVPCRIGTKRLLEILTRITEGEGQKRRYRAAAELAEDVRDSSFAGSACRRRTRCISTIAYFRHEYEAHINQKKCPAKVCNAADLLSSAGPRASAAACVPRPAAVNAITGEKKQPHVIDKATCIQCGSCFDACKFNAVIKE
jgi:NADH:ubiquinone oxidoreductase subunit F (NADH-binding)